MLGVFYIVVSSNILLNYSNRIGIQNTPVVEEFKTPAMHSNSNLFVDTQQSFYENFELATAKHFVWLGSISRRIIARFGTYAEVGKS